MSLDPWLSFLTLALFLYVFVSSSGMLWLHDSKDEYGPVGVPDLFQKEEKATLFPRVHIGNPKILIDSNHDWPAALWSCCLGLGWAWYFSTLTPGHCAVVGGFDFKEKSHWMDKPQYPSWKATSLGPGRFIGL